MRKALLLVLLPVLAFSQQISGGGSGSAAGGASGQYSTASVGYSVGTIYFPPGGGLAANATEANVQGTAAVSGTISNFTATLSAAPGGGNSITFTWRKGGSDQLVTCAISGASAKTCSDTTNSFSVSPGDLVDIKAVVAGGTVTATVVLQWATPGIAGPQGVQGPAGPAPAGTGMVKSNSGTAGLAVAGTDYAAPTTGTFVLKGDNAGGFAQALGSDIPAISESQVTSLATDLANRAVLNGANTYTGGGLQDFSVMKVKPGAKTVGGLPSAASNTNVVYLVTDGTSVSDCTTGAGNTLVWCGSNGAAWVAVGGSGGGGGGGGTNSVFAASTATNSSNISGTAVNPVFSLADIGSSPPKSPIVFEPAALSANVSSVTFSGKTAGAVFWIHWLNDGTGGRTVSYGASASNTCSISPVASKSTWQQFIVASDGSTVTGAGCITDEGGPVRVTAVSAPGTPITGTGVFWEDITAKNFFFKNDAGTVNHGVQTNSGSANNFVTAISDAGVISIARPTCGNLSDSSGGCSMSTSAGGDLGGTLPNPTVLKINGTSVPTNSAATQMLMTSASATAVWVSWTDCQDSGGNHVNFTASTRTITCGSSSSGGGAGAAVLPYSQTVTAQTSVSISAATHQQGTLADATCWDNSTPRVNVSCGNVTRNSSGDLVFTFSPAFTGLIQVGSGGGTSTPLTTKGDILSFTTVPARLAVGTDGKVLTASSGQTTGLDWTTVPTANQNTRTISFIFAGSPTAGDTTCAYVKQTGTINQATISAEASFSGTIDVKTVAYSSYTGPASTSSITASAVPTLSAATKGKDSTLTGWTTTLSGDQYVCGVMTYTSGTPKWVRLDLAYAAN